MIRGCAVAGLLALLSGCGTTNSVERSMNDPALVSTYQMMTQAMQRNNLSRRDRDPADVTYTRDDLVRNFMTVAFNVEADIFGGDGNGPGRPVPLHRWDGGFAYALAGTGVTENDRALMVRLASRITALTGLELTFTEEPEDAEMTILVVGPDERDDLRRMIARRIKGDRAAGLLRWPDVIASPCMGSLGGDDDGIIRGALVLIRSETRGLLRESCFEEEVIQSLGLLNDSNEVRPSIFNDLQEFALMTVHDEYLLRTLYDTRLSPGMTAEEARPIVETIMRDLRPDTGSAPTGSYEYEESGS